MSPAENNEHFKTFAGQLQKLKARYGSDKDSNKYQREQVERLIDLEKQWRQAVVNHRYGPWVYKRFVNFISGEKRNILAARPYFRERQDVFAKQISKALKKGEGGVPALFKFSINYQFVLFVMKQRNWGENSQITQLAREIGKLRQDIVAINLPLGIARARVFYSRTPKSHLSYMDEIQIAAEGMMSGVDKYSPGKNGKVNPKAFRATMINRISGDHIEEYSQTLIHFFPVDKRKLYRAHKLVRFFASDIDFEKLAEQVSDTAKKGEVGGEVDASHKTTASEINDLMAASSTVSADSSLPTDPDAPEPITRFAAPEATRPDVQVENHAAMMLMAQAEERLTLFERKLLRLKGLRLDEIRGIS